MPFGAEVGRTAATRFRLWAPARERVELDARRATARAPCRCTRGRRRLVRDVARAGAPPARATRFRIDGGLAVPDPASRCNPDDVHGPSEVVDPRAYEWRDDDWRGRPWHEAVIYELHVGTFTPEGTFAGRERAARLPRATSASPRSS